MTHTAMPADVDEWTHARYGPNHVPVSQDTRVGPWVNGVRFMVGDTSRGSTQNAVTSRSTRLAGGRMYTPSSKSRGRGLGQQRSLQVLMLPTACPCGVVR